MSPDNAPHNALRHHVTGAIERGEAEPIIEVRWWCAYVPLHLAGSGGNRLVGKFQATAAEVDETFGRCASIDYAAGVIEFFKRP